MSCKIMSDVNKVTHRLKKKKKKITNLIMLIDGI